MTGKVLNGNSTGILILILPVAAAIILLYKAWPILLILFLLTIIWRLWDTYQWKQWCQQLNPFFNQLVKENQGCLTPMDLSMKTNLSGRAATRFLERKAQEYGAIRKNQGETGTVYYFLTATALGSIFDDSDPEILPESDRPLSAFTDSEEKEETETVTETSPPETEIFSETTLESPSEDVTPAESVTASSSPETPSSSPFAQLAALKEERQQTDATISEQVEKREILEDFSEKEESKIDSTLAKGLIQADLAKRLDLNPSTIGRRKSDPDFAEWSQSKDPDGIAWKYLRKSRLFVPIE